MAYTFDGQTLPSTNLFEGRFFYDNNAWGTSNGVLGYYDNTNDQWLSVQEFERTLTTGSLSADSFTVIGKINDAKAIFVTGFYITTYVATTNSSVSYWSIGLRSYQANYSAGSYTGVISTLPTSSDSPDTWTDHDADVSFSDQSPANYGVFALAYSKAGTTGTPGNLTAIVSVKFRYILT